MLPVTPLHPIHLPPPTTQDARRSGLVREFATTVAPVPNKSIQARRERALAQLQDLVCIWARHHSARAQLVVTGSERLHLAGPTSDIDVLCISTLPKTLFFSQLPAILQTVSSVTHCAPILEAAVPLIEVVLRIEDTQVEFDLMYAAVGPGTFPPRLLEWREPAGEEPTDAPDPLLSARVTEVLCKLVGDDTHWQLLARIVRAWAKAKGVYGFRFGYLGGVHVNILTAYIALRFAGHPVSTLLVLFFELFSRWKWPSPVTLCEHAPTATRGDMPLLLPWPPYANCMYSATRHTRATIQNAMREATEALRQGALQPLVTPSTFFADMDAYCSVTSRDIGLLEARIRKLVRLIQEEPSVREARVFPATYTLEDDSRVLFLGIRARAATVDIRGALQQFRAWMNSALVTCTPLTWSQLPDCVFRAGLSREAAKTLRRARLRVTQTAPRAAGSTADTAR